MLKRGIHSRSLMGAGGTAPKMKMSEVFILSGTTILLGALFMHAWVTPVAITGEDSIYTNGASMMKGDTFELDIRVQNETTLRIVFLDENEGILSAESIVVASGERIERSLEAEESGYYTYEIDTKGAEATLEFSIDRKYKIDLIPYPLGGFLLAFGLHLRSAEETDSSDVVLDAELDD